MKLHYLKMIILSILMFGCREDNKTAFKTWHPLMSKDNNDSVEKKNNLIVVVGEYIDFNHLPNARDYGVRAKYKVLELVYGTYDREVIEFKAYDHYQVPEFVNYKNALLFISKEDTSYYLEKYMYDLLFKTKDGRWAGPYSSEYGHPYNQSTNIKPVFVDFATPVLFSRIITDNEGKVFELTYPEPFFKNRRDSAIALYGNFIPELFALRKEGVLTARGLFSGRTLNDSITGAKHSE